MTSEDRLVAALQAVRQHALGSLPQTWPELERVLASAPAKATDPQCAIPLATTRAVGAQFEDALPFAAAWLLICMSVRILDDVGDGDNPEGMDRAIGAAAAMNLGSGLLVHAGHLLARLPAPGHRVTRVLDGYHAMAMHAFAAQGRDLAGNARTFTTYQRLVEGKTALPFAFAGWGSAALHADDPRILAACRDAGFHIGVMLQLLDDMEACWFPDGPSDLTQGKLTYPIYMGLEQPGDLAVELARLVHAADAPYHEPRILEILDELDVRDRLIWAAIRERDTALAALRRCPDPAGLAICQMFVDWTMRDVDELRRRSRRTCAA